MVILRGATKDLRIPTSTAANRKGTPPMVRTKTPGHIVPSLAIILAVSLSGEARTAEADPAAAQAGQPTRESAVLGIAGGRFTLDGKPAFLLGLSFYGGLGAPEEFVSKDLDDAKRLGFNWIRLWATWGAFGNDVSAVGLQGEPREPFLKKLVWLVGECDRRGIAVDVTLTRSKDRLASIETHRRGVETVVGALKRHRNWYLDLANERDVRDDRFVSAGELKVLRELVRSLDPSRLVTASFGGHDLGRESIQEGLEIGLDFLCPHRPREKESPGQTEAATRACRSLMEGIGRTVPIHYQEPFRRGYGSWEPRAEDFLEDLQGAVTGGAAGWCLHNGGERRGPGNEPRRSFDLRSRRLFDSLDAEERKVAAEAGKLARGKPAEG
jgi:hypothetical protein